MNEDFSHPTHHFFRYVEMTQREAAIAHHLAKQTHQDPSFIKTEGQSCF